MSGSLAIVGIGPGPTEWITPAASARIAAASDLVGYAPYLARLPEGPQTRHASDNRVELGRACLALRLAAEGRQVALISGGDPGVFAMAATVFEAIEAGEADWRALDIVVEPGISAMLAAAARLGAPLGADFAAISLSDNLKPLETVLRRVTAAAEAGLVLALYNPVSQARAWQLDRVFEQLRSVLPGETIIAFARAIGRPDERIAQHPLAKAEGRMADMATLVIVGSAQTRRIARPDGSNWLYSPRTIRAST